MEIQELMIGDWVSINGRKCKVSYIAPFDIGDARLSVISNDYDGNHYVDCVEPIPLTEEILKVNGVEHEKVCDFWYKKIEERTWLTISIWFNRLYEVEIGQGSQVYGKTSKKVVRCNLEPNVHDLQHVLRLCGLNELAENFRIE